MRADDVVRVDIPAARLAVLVTNVARQLTDAAEVEDFVAARLAHEAIGRLLSGAVRPAEAKAWHLATTRK